MYARLIKETRELLPMFAGTLLLIVVPCLIWRDSARELGCVAFGLACAVLGGCSFGNEFQHRTLWLLLSQPIARSVLWRDKMLILGGGMLASLAVLMVCLQVYYPWPASDRWPLLVLISLCAFCGAPYWTLLLRHGIGGMAFATAFPCLLLAVNALVTERLSNDQAVKKISAGILILSYCVVVYWRGYARFKRLQVVDGLSRELSLPAELEAFFVRPLTMISARFRGPFASLLKKEFRLQQISFLLAGLFFLIAVAGACLVKLHRDLAEAIVGFDCMIYVVILPLIAGATSLAEEKGWGIAEWHLTLPPSALKQWSAKMLVTLSTGLTLGLLLPTALSLAVIALFSQPGARASLPPALQILGWILGSLLLTSVAVYAASFSSSTLRAILAAFVISAAGVGVLWLAATGVNEFDPGPRDHPHLEEWLILPLLSGGLVFMLCLIQWFAWSNSRRCGVPARRLLVQLTAIFLSVYLSVWLIAWIFFSALSFSRYN